MKAYGLIGYPLTSSFSPAWFNQKFQSLKLNASYELFPMVSVGELRSFIEAKPLLAGLNVTIPHKTAVLAQLDDIDPIAAEVGAVNTIVIERHNRLQLTGYNTDIIGFENSLLTLIGEARPKALVLGTGGAALAVHFVLKKLGITWLSVSTKPKAAQIGYPQLNENLLQTHPLIINTTPLGMEPTYAQLFPNLPYEHFHAGMYVYDLVYHPATTPLLKQAMAVGAAFCNGLKMLQLQADAAWELWNRA
jgi:shikimate dehydrogenase